MSGPYLATSLRKQLAKTIDQARKVAEAGSAEVIRRLGVAEAKAPTHLDEDGKRLRNALRAHGRALGDQRQPSGEQAVAKLKEATAYEHWHRMLFARFLAERGLLIHPGYRAPVSLEDCKDLAAEEGLPDAWAVAERYATRMLPGIFRPDDPSLALTLAPEDAAALRGLVLGLEPAVFAAADSLGWTYQFWRAAEKDAVNKAGGKIGADELPAVTQLFTEPYMVQFLLHNTLGAWWAGKRLAAEPELARTAVDEPAVRAAVSLPGIDWAYLRFVREGGVWQPAAGTFSGWPERAAQITVMDPCCGSGHFLVEALGILAALRIAEEGLAPAEAVSVVLGNNLFGLEIDGRCVQIAAFAVALAAWQLASAVIDLPRPHIAWVGQAPAVGKNEWLRLAEAIAAKGPVPPKRDLLGTEDNLFSSPDRWALELLWGLFGHAPLLGSLLDFSAAPPLFADRLAGFEGALAEAAFGESETGELALMARGMADAARLLARHYVLQVTNVPFLTRRNQHPQLTQLVEAQFADAEDDLGTAMLCRMSDLALPNGTVAAVTPQPWLHLNSFKILRERWLGSFKFLVVVELGSRAFAEIGGERVQAALVIVDMARTNDGHRLHGLDANLILNSEEKARGIAVNLLSAVSQKEARTRPGSSITVAPRTATDVIGDFAIVRGGTTSGDSPFFRRYFWEILAGSNRFVLESISFSDTQFVAGRECALLWEGGDGELAKRTGGRGATIAGRDAWGREGIAISYMSNMAFSLYHGSVFENVICVMIPKRVSDLAALWCFCTNGALTVAVRQINTKLSVDVRYFEKADVDMVHWRRVAAELYPDGLAEPYSGDPTQWLFHGHPAQAMPGTALHVALARLAGYRWPAENDTEMRLAAEARDWIAKAATLPPADADGILCLPSVGGEASLAERLRAFLAAAFGAAWTAGTERRLLADAAERFKERPPADLEDWLRNRFFRQHCVLFHHRPFLWHVSDGQRDGFAAVLHYHRLTKATLQKLTYTVLGDWLARMNDLGDGRRHEAARTLQQKLELILVGEKPYDIFVRWKPREHLPLGWVPDLDDGVRQNIRPFIRAGVLAHDLSKILKAKDRGTDLPSAPWYHLFKGERINDHHTTLAEKQAARDAARKAS